METNVISLSVDDRRIKATDHVKPTAGNVAHDVVAITLDSEWDALGKRVTFYRDGVEVTLPYSEQIEVPWEVLTEPGTFGVTVVGSKDGKDRLVTAAMSMSERIRVSTNGEDEGVDPKQPTEDILHRVERIAGEMESGEAGRESRFEDFMETAGTNVQQATDKAEGAATSANQAGQYAANAGSMAIEAKGEAEMAASEIREAAQRGDFDGADGVSPTATVERTEGGATVTVTDRDGTTTAEIMDGKDGAPGKDADPKVIADMQRRINILEAAAEGKTHIWETVTEDTSETAVPSDLAEKDGSGYADLVAIEGKTVVWNQLFKPRFEDLIGVNTSGVTFNVRANGTIEASGTASSTAIRWIVGSSATEQSMQFDVTEGHKIAVVVPGATNTGGLGVQLVYADGTVGCTVVSEGYIYTATRTSKAVPRLIVYSGRDATSIIKPMFFDLTVIEQSLGVTINTVEQFRAMFPDDYYPYSEPAIKSLEVAQVESWGRNLLDLSDAFGKTLSTNATYSTGHNIDLPTDTYRFTCYDEKGNYFVPSNIALKDKTGTNIVISAFGSGKTVTREQWNEVVMIAFYDSEAHVLGKAQLERGTTAHAYSPYGMKDSVSLPDVELKSAGTAKDRLEWTGDVQRKVGIVDLGTLNWTHSVADDGRSYFQTSEITDYKRPIDAGTKANAVCSAYTVDALNNVWSNDNDKTIGFRATQNYVAVCDRAYTDVASFKAAMQGQMLYYELATPTTESVTLPDSWLPAEAGGSIRYKDSDGKPVAVPHSVEFPVKVV